MTSRILVGVLALAACHRAAPQPSLADRVEQRIRTAHPEVTIERPNDATFVIKMANGGKVELSLDNLRVQCERKPDECETGIGNMLSSLTLTLTQLAAADEKPRREQVRAVLKDARFLDMVRKRVAEGPKEKEHDNQPIVRAFAGDLWIAYVLDSPTSTQMITYSTLRRLGLDERALHELAMANLEKTLTDLPHKPFTPGSHVFLVKAGDDYEASRMLLPHLWRAATREVKGRLLAAAPARHVVLFTGSADLNDIATLMSAAKDLAAHEHHAISPTVFEFTGSGWRPAKKLP